MDPDPPPQAPPRDGRRLHVVQMAPELDPVAKVGGLADMVAGLSRGLAGRGHRVEVVCPAYGGLKHGLVADGRLAWDELWVPHHGEWRPEMVHQGRVGGVDTFFVTGGSYFLRPRVYGYEDDLYRFAYFYPVKPAEHPGGGVCAYYYIFTVSGNGASRALPRPEL